jgi:hypothetical protein
MRHAAEAAGADRVIDKPGSPDDLLRPLRELSRQKSGEFPRTGQIHQINRI